LRASAPISPPDGRTSGRSLLEGRSSDDPSAHRARARQSRADAAHRGRPDRGGPSDSLAWREAPDAWTPVQVLSHLADGEITDWMPRIERILAGGGRFTPFDMEGSLARYRDWSAEALVGEFGQLRRANLDRLDRLTLTAPHLRLTGEHPELGVV